MIAIFRPRRRLDMGRWPGMRRIGRAPTGPLKEGPKLRGQFRQRSLRGRGAGDDHHVHARGHLIHQGTAPLPQPAAHPVSLHRTSQLLTHYEPKSLSCFRLPQGMNHEAAIRPRAPAPVDRLEAALLPQAQLAGQHALHSQAMPPFGAPGREHVSPVQSAHAAAEPMGALASAVMGLKSSLHSIDLQIFGELYHVPPQEARRERGGRCSGVQVFGYSGIQVLGAPPREAGREPSRRRARLCMRWTDCAGRPVPL
jgi:hypothetical protein